MRALRVGGPQDPDALGERVGAAYWDDGRYERAIALLVADGLAFRLPDGQLTAA